MKAEGTAVLLVGLLVGTARAHDWGWMDCPTMKPMAGFNVNKFLGLWYVIELFDSSSTCQTLNYTRLTETQLAVTKGRQLSILDSLNIDHSNSYTGKLDMPDGDNAGRMRVKWPLNVAGKADYIVFDTDYAYYAAIFECQQISALAHRKSATILSRTQSLADTYIDRVKRLMAVAGVEISHFDKIDHSACTRRSDVDLNIDIDDNTFQEIVSSAGDGIKTVATQLTKLFQVADGASSFADTVVDVTRRLASSTDGNNGASAQQMVVPSGYEDVEIIS